MRRVAAAELLDSGHARAETACLGPPAGPCGPDFMRVAAGRREEPRPIRQAGRAGVGIVRAARPYFVALLRRQRPEPVPGPPCGFDQFLRGLYGSPRSREENVSDPPELVG